MRQAIEAALRDRPATGYIVVADAAVAKLHEPPLAGEPYVALAGGAQRKSIATWRGLLDRMVAEGLDREAVLVAFGGGTVLDVAGFAAATYLRGIRWISVPTTLLAMVDAAHGGKTGIDHPAAKNLIGAFHPPVDVLLDPGLLATLPVRELRSGLAEVVKHGVIGDPELLEMAGRDDPATFVERAAKVKLDIVARDPREENERRLLNLGHTLGHAVEIASDYALAHGEAVAVGLRAACRIAADHCGFRQGEAVAAALDRCGLPATAAVDRADVRAALAHDKKRKGDRLRWVLPVALGNVCVYDDVPDDLVERALEGVLA
jgi:3-dehydroquinate synthetase